MGQRPLFRYFYTFLWLALAGFSNISNATLVSELEQEILSLQPSSHYVVDDLQGDKIPSRTGGKDAVVRIKKQITKQDKDIFINATNIPQEQKEFLLNFVFSKALPPNSQAKSDDIADYLQPVKNGVAQNELSLEGVLFLDLGGLSRRDIENGFTWIVWLKELPSPYKLGVHSTLFNAYSDYYTHINGQRRDENRIETEQVSLISSKFLGNTLLLQGEDQANGLFHKISESAPEGLQGVKQYTLTYDGERLKAYENNTLLVQNEVQLSVKDRKYFYIGYSISHFVSKLSHNAIQRVALFPKTLNEQQITSLAGKTEEIRNEKYDPEKVAKQFLLDEFYEQSLQRHDYSLFNVQNFSSSSEISKEEYELAKRVCGFFKFGIDSQRVIPGNISLPDKLLIKYNDKIIPNCFKSKGLERAQTPDEKAGDYNSLESTQGNFRVDESGQVSYSIDFSLPDGVAGVKPQLGLSYSSAAGAGNAGWGWNLSGVSSIARCGSDFIRDGFQRGVMMDNKDNYCMDGQRLVFVDQRYYVKEQNDFSRIYKKGDGFEVHTKANETYYYGNIDTPFPLNTSQNEYTYGGAWMLKGLRDAFGNYIRFHYSYDRAQGEYLIDTIEYGGNYQQNTSAFNRVKIHYQNRNKPKYGYRNGKKVSTTKVVTGIEITKDGHPYRYYDVVFNSARADKNIVKEVVECINQGYQCRLPIRFEMTPKDSNGGLASGTETVSGQYDNELYRYQFADLNGDSYSDLIGYRKKDEGALFIRYGTSSGFSEQEIIAHPTKPNITQLMDFNSDGLTDILYIKDGTWYAIYHDQTGSRSIMFINSLENFSSNLMGQVSIADYDGDGLSDFVVMSNNASIHGYRNQGDGNFEAKIKLQERLKNTLKAIQLIPGAADFNGDGLSDVVMMIQDGSGGRTTPTEPIKPMPHPGSTHRTGLDYCNHTMENAPGRYRDLQECICEVLPGDRSCRVRGEAPRLESLSGSHRSSLRSRRMKRSTAIHRISNRTYPLKVIATISEGKTDSQFNQIDLTRMNADMNVQYADLNHDGLTDLLIHDKKTVSYRLSNGHRFTDEAKLFAITPEYSHDGWTVKETLSNLVPADLDHDGNLEFYFSVKLEKSIHEKVRVTSLSGRSYEKWKTRKEYSNELRKAKIFQQGGSDPFTVNQTNSPIYQNTSSKGFDFQFVDIKGNGHFSLMIFDLDKKALYRKDNLSSHHFIGDKMKKVTVGYSSSKETGANISTNITYASVKNTAVYDPETQSNTTTYVPKTGQPLVSKVTSSTYDMALGRDVADTVTYKYAGLKLDRRGLGSLGFRQITSRSSRDGTKTVTTYGQGRYNRMMPLTTKEYFANGKLSKSSENQYQTLSIIRDKTSYATYLKRVVDRSYTMTSNGQHRYLGKTETTFGQDRYGNMTSSIVNMFDDSGTVLHRTTTENEFGSRHEEKRYGRLSEVKVTKKQFAHTIAGVTQPESTMRKRSLFTYYQDGVKKGMLKSEVTEPGLDTEKTVTRDYDAFGNTVMTKSQTKLGARVASVQYDSRGRYVDHTTDALGRKTYHFYNGRSAEEVEGPFYSQATVSPAKLITTQYFSNYGLVIRTVYPDGTEKRTTKSYCQGSCWGKALIKVVESKTGMSDSVSYLDRYGRTVMTESTLIDGSVSQTRTTYNADNQVVRAYQPAKGNAQSSIYVETRYDQYKRPIAKVHSNGSQKTIGYYGRVTEASSLGHLLGEYIYVQNVVSPLGNEIVTFAPTIQAQMGEVGQVSARARVQKIYDAYGQLQNSSTFAQDANGDMQSSVVSVNYDPYGRKLSTSDPEKGTWSYTYDAFGQMLTQTDANGITTTFKYDRVGRLLSSSIPRFDKKKDILTCKTYENDMVPWIGKVLEMSINEVEPGVRCFATNKRDALQHVAYTYDNLGRALQTTTTMDKTKQFVTSVSYDELGRVATQSYPNGFVIKNAYAQNGQLKAVRNAETNALYHQVDAVDALGRVTKETVLGGVTRSKDFDAQRGWVKDIRVKSTAHGDVYHVRYDHFENGSTKSRSSEYFDNTGASDNTTPFLSVEENFSFDPVFDRLTKREVNFQTDMLRLGSSVAKAEEYRYDGFGNLAFKTGVGDYQYDAAKPHRLVATQQGENVQTKTMFTYDSSGNITKQSGHRNKQFAYTSRHKVRSVVANGKTTTFKYGLGNQRYYRQDLFTGTSGSPEGSQTTYYLGKLYEYVSATARKDKSGKALPDLSWETYYVGSIAIKRFSDGRDDVTRVMHGDALGSTVAVTDENGLMVSQSLFDPFGQRQDVIASASQADQYQPIEANRGFTGHEDIQGTDIIHMNGRIYDADIGRFMQADPFIQYPSDTQGYNRYAYVQNNPLKFTDPSGFFLKKLLNAAGELTGAKWVLKQLARNKYLNMGVQIGLAFLPGGPLWTAAYVGMYAGAQSYYMTGSLGAGIRAGAIAFGTAYAMHKIGEYARANYGGATEATGISLGKNSVGEVIYASAGNFSKVVAMHAVVGGLSAKASGGKFSHGFFSAGFTKFATPTIVGNISNQYYQVAASMVVGGTASVISGGKFANGAKTAAYQMIFNQLGGSQSTKQKRKTWNDMIDEFEASLEEAFNMGDDSDYSSYIKKVGTGGDWDFKNRFEYKHLPGVEEFGNFAFGATSQAWADGFSGGLSTFFPKVSTDLAMRGAGWYQEHRQPKNYRASDGTWLDRNSYPGNTNYGDNWRDQGHIYQGAQYYFRYKENRSK